jgi:hypothetical protein
MLELYSSSLTKHLSRRRWFGPHRGGEPYETRTLRRSLDVWLN